MATRRRIRCALFALAIAACDERTGSEEPADAGSMGDGDGDGDAGADGGDDAWSCLDEAPADAPTELTLALQVRDFVTGDTPDGLQAFVCLHTDIDCRRPVAGPHEVVDGALRFTIADVPTGGFDGYIRLTAPQLLPLELQFARPLRRDVTYGADDPLPMFSPLVFQNPLALMDPQLDLDAAGVLMFRLRDCAGRPAAGLRAEAEPAEAEAFFSADEAWMATRDAAATTASGRGGLIELMPAMQSITVSEVASARVLYDFRVDVSPRTIVFVDVRPAEL